MRWEPGLIRLFVSHRAEEREVVGNVASELAGFGVCSFVAHQTIEISLPWRAEIQEIGWALGRSVPTIVLLYPDVKLRGFLEQYQAIPVEMPDPEDEWGSSGDLPGAIASKVFAALAESAPLRGRIVDGLIEALGRASGYVAAGKAAEILESMGDELRRSDVVAILKHFESNDQVHRAILANVPLKRLVASRAPDLYASFWPDANEAQT